MICAPTPVGAVNGAPVGSIAAVTGGVEPGILDGGVSAGPPKLAMYRDTRRSSRGNKDNDDKKDEHDKKESPQRGSTGREGK